MFPTKTRSDVGMVVAAWNNQLAEKVQEQGGVFRDSNNPVNIRQPQDTYVLWIRFHHHYIWQHFDMIRTVHHSIYFCGCQVLKCVGHHVPTNLMHTRLEFQCAWPVAI